MGMPRDGRFLVQEHLPGEEHSLDVLATPTGAVLAVVPRLRLKVDSGVAVAGRTLHDPELERLAPGRGGGHRAVLGRQRPESAGRARVRPRLLEVNPRFPGTMPLTVAAGVDMPAICLSMALGEPAPADLVVPGCGHGPVPGGAIHRRPQRWTAIPSRPAVAPSADARARCRLDEPILAGAGWLRSGWLSDGHVHSTFSDGASDPAANLRAGVAAGLTGMVMTDHVRARHDWLPASWRPSTGCGVDAADRASASGVETKLLDTRGPLDLPAATRRRRAAADRRPPVPDPDRTVPPSVVGDALRRAAPTRRPSSRGWSAH